MKTNETPNASRMLARAWQAYHAAVEEATRCGRLAAERLGQIEALKERLSSAEKRAPEEA